MKSAILVSLSLIVLATATDLHAGKHQKGDVLVESRRLVAGVRRNGMDRPTYTIEQIWNIDGIITTVEGVNAEGSNALVNIQAGGPGKNYVVVGAFTGADESFDVQLDVFAIPSSAMGSPSQAST